jgi:nucleoside-diphosphate-sugar epimerase
MNKSSIGIIGCGWLGLPLGIKFVNMGWLVKGTTTRTERRDILRNHGIEPHILNLPKAEIIEKDLLNVENLILNIPPGRRDTDVIKNYSNSIYRLINSFKKENAIKKLVFVSSTSVYGKDTDIIDENSSCIPESNSGKSLVIAENAIRESGLPFIILRFGGLAGPNRHPGRFLAGRKDLDIGNQSVNFLHLVDAVNVIYYMVTHQIENETFNVVAPMHPTKKEFYAVMAESINLEPPTFVQSSDLKKCEVSVVKLLSQTEFKFTYQDPMKFAF